MEIPLLLQFFLLVGLNDDWLKTSQWVDRVKIMQLNAPQCFKYSYVLWLYEEGQRKGLISKLEPHTTTLMYELVQTIYFAK